MTNLLLYVSCSSAALMAGVKYFGIPYLVNSAINLDGGPMIVGGGAWEGGIPEPSGGILFLLGAAALGLRRRSRDLL